MCSSQCQQGLGSGFCALCSHPHSRALAQSRAGDRHWASCVDREDMRDNLLKTRPSVMTGVPAEVDGGLGGLSRDFD